MDNKPFVILCAITLLLYGSVALNPTLGLTVLLGTLLYMVLPLKDEE